MGRGLLVLGAPRGRRPLRGRRLAARAEPEPSIPPWSFWSVAFAFLAAVVEWAGAAEREAWSDYVASSVNTETIIVKPWNRSTTSSDWPYSQITPSNAFSVGRRYATAFSGTGSGIELQAVAAVVIGGVAIFGGSGTVWGAAIGAFLLVTINRALPILGIFYILVRLIRQVTTGLWKKTRGKTLQRATRTSRQVASTSGTARPGRSATWSRNRPRGSSSRC